MHKKILMFQLFIFACVAILSLATRADDVSGANQAQKQMFMQSLSRMPLSFTKNQGQWGEKVLFRADAGGTIMWFTTDGVYYQFIKTVSKKEPMPDDPFLGQLDRFDSKPDSVQYLLIKASFVGGNPKPRIKGEDMLEYKCSYFLGNDPAKWRINVSNYQAIVLEEIYPGIDLKYYGNGRKMEYDFVISPGVDYTQIRVQYNGVKSLTVNNSGELVVETDWGEVTELPPLVYQIENDARRPLHGRYQLIAKNTFGFELEDGYDQNLPLIIDPVLTYSTYLGGTNTDGGTDIAVDGSGCAYVTGYTLSSDFPTQNPYDASLNGGYDIFVTKLSSSGLSLLYSTYIGGSADDWPYGIAVDNSGSAYIVGRTSSTDFPTANAYDNTYNGSYTDVCVTKLTPAGNSLSYSTYLGGNYLDEGYAIAVDANGCACVTGVTKSPNFPMVNADDPSYNGNKDVFLTKFSSAGNSLVFSTFLGGTADEYGRGICYDASGTVYVTGDVASSDFPMVNAFDNSYNGSGDVFVSKFSPTGDLLYSTFLGGSSYERGNAIAVGGDGSIYVTGRTGSSDFPMFYPYDGSFNGGSSYGDVFVTRFTTSGSSLLFSTFIGGASDDYATDIHVDSDGDAYIAGSTSSSDFPTYHAYDDTYNGSGDGFITKLWRLGNFLTSSSFFGGSGSDGCAGITSDNQGNIYITGYTSSPDFPLASSYDSSPNGGSDAFVAKFSFANHIELYPTSIAFSAFQNGSLPGDNTLEIINSGDGLLNWSVSDDAAWLEENPSSGSGNSQNITISVNTTNLSLGTHYATITVTGNADNSPQTVQVSYTISVPPHITINYTDLSFSATQNGTLPDPQTFWITNSGGGTLNWSLSDDAPWLIESPLSGNSNDQVIKVSVNTTDLSEGTHDAVITVFSNNADNSPQMVVIHYSIIVLPCNDMLFRPDPNGWQFANVVENMWPQSWWSQFDYTQYPYPPGFKSRYLCQSWQFPDWPLFVSAFGEDQCYFDPPPGWVTFKPSAIWKWIHIRDFWGGSCYGFAVSSFLFFDNYLDLNSLFPGYTHLYQVPISDQSRFLINKYQLYQYGKSQRDQDLANWTTTPIQTLARSKEMFNSSTRDDKTLLLPGHVVNTYKCETDPGNPDRTKFYVYENGAPGVPQWGYINTAANTWSYMGEEGSRGLFLSLPMSDYLTNPILLYSQDSPLMRAAAIDSSPPDLIELYIRASRNAELVSPIGNIGQIGDSAFNTLPEGIPIIPRTGYNTTPIGYYLPDTLWEIYVSKIVDSTFSIGLFSDSNVIVYWRSDADTAQSEKLVYDINGKSLSVYNPDVLSRSYSLDIISMSPDSEIVCGAENVTISHQDSIRYSTTPGKGLRIDNFGQTTAYNARFEIAGVWGDTVFFHAGVSLPERSSHEIIPDWRQNNDSLMILVDSGMTGSFGDTIFVVNEGEVHFIRGDANGDGVINVVDVVYLINYKFLDPPGPAPQPWAAGDVNCDGIINVTDIVYLINYLFIGGPPPGC